MPSNADKYEYGIIASQLKYPVIVHKPHVERPRQAGCGRSRGQDGIRIQTRLLDGKATVYCSLCWEWTDAISHSR